MIVSKENERMAKTNFMVMGMYEYSTTGVNLGTFCVFYTNYAMICGKIIVLWVISIPTNLTICPLDSQH